MLPFKRLSSFIAFWYLSGRFLMSFLLGAFAGYYYAYAGADGLLYFYYWLDDLGASC